MKKPPSQRQLKVGELIRQALSKLFMRGEIPYLGNLSITVSEVRISPDLRNATAFIYPLGGEMSDDLMAVLAEYEGFIRKYVVKEVYLKRAPQIHFKLDTSFEYAENIDRLLRQLPEKEKDLLPA